MKAPIPVRYAAIGEAQALAASVEHTRLRAVRPQEADVVLTVGAGPPDLPCGWVSVAQGTAEGLAALDAGASAVVLKQHATADALGLALLQAAEAHLNRVAALALKQAPVPAVGLVDRTVHYTFLAGTDLAAEGIDADASLGAPVGTFSTPEVGEATRQAHVQAQQRGEQTVFPFDRDGRPFEARVYPVRREDGDILASAALILSLAAEKKALRDKQVSEDRFSLLAQTTQDLVVIHEPDGTIQWASSSARVHLGRDPESFVGEHPLSYVDPRDHDRFQAVGDAIAAGTTAPPVSFRALRPDGSVVWMESSVATLRDADGTAVQLFTIGRCVDNIKRNETRLESLAEEAQRTARARASFLAVMSHELRTPLHGILGMTQVLEKGPLHEEQAHGLKLIATSGRALLDLIDNVLDFSRMESGTLTCERRPTDVIDVLEDAIDISSGLLGTKPVELTWFSEGRFLPRLFTDPARLRQVLVNLISNAVRFTKEGAVWVVVQYQDGTLGFDVHDTGPGIPNDRLEAIFEPFTQGDASTVRRFGGSGLGLTIARGLIQALGGTLSATSEPGQGACFHIRIPADPAPAKPCQPQLQGHRIAVVGSGLTAQRSIPRFIEFHGARAIVLAEPEDGPIPPYVDAVVWASPLDPAPWQATYRHADWVVLRPVGEADHAPGVVRTPVRRQTLLRALDALGADDDPTVNTEEIAPGKVWPLRVLLVDDTPTNRLVAARMLSTLQYESVQAASGRKALEVLASEPIDVILLDLHMPGMSGQTVAAQVRQGDVLLDPSAPPVILALTADVEASSPTRLPDFDGYLSKPLSLQTLATALRTAHEVRRTGTRAWITGHEGRD